MKNLYLNNRRVFVAGATGSVGSAVIRHLLNNFPDIRLQASYLKTKPFILDKRIKYVKADLRNIKDCVKAAKGCDCAVMAAASTYGSASSVSKPHLQVNDNLIMNARLLEAFHGENIKRVVFIGSATLYQPFEGSINENQLDLNKDPHEAYLGVGWVMRYLEKLCAFWHHKYGMEVLIARASNAFGPYSKFNPGTATFIPAIIRKAVDKMDPFEVWGSPDVARDVIFSEDLASAVAAMLNAVEIKFDVFNVGSGRQVLVSEVVDCALSAAGHRPLKIKYETGKPSTAKSRLIDITKITAKLGWKPAVSLQKAVADTTNWWIENKGAWKK